MGLPEPWEVGGMGWDGMGLPSVTVLLARSAQQPKQRGEMARLGSSDRSAPGVKSRSAKSFALPAALRSPCVRLCCALKEGMGCWTGTAVKVQGAELGSVLHLRAGNLGQLLALPGP